MAQEEYWMMKYRLELLEEQFENQRRRNEDLETRIIEIIEKAETDKLMLNNEIDELHKMLKKSPCTLGSPPKDQNARLLCSTAPLHFPKKKKDTDNYLDLPILSLPEVGGRTRLLMKENLHSVRDALSIPEPVLFVFDGRRLPMKSWLFPIFLSLPLLTSAQEEATPACKSALEACENDLECSNRLAPLMAACTTSTCQPQCRNAVLNVYQNKLGRALLRSDGTCIPGREELRSCNFMPTGSQVHCSVAKLVCEGDLQCNSKWGVFVSECEAESGRGECSPKCRGLFSAAATTPGGTPFNNCTCTEREDNLCINLRDNVLGPCTKAPVPPIPEGTNSITEAPAADDSLAALPSVLVAFIAVLVVL